VTEGRDAGDPIGLVLPAMGFGAALGIALQVMVAFGVDALRGGAPIAQKPSLGSAHALLLLLGTPAAMVAAGLATWTLVAPIRNPWRQAMFAIVVALGSFVLSALLIWPMHASFGRGGIFAVIVAAALVCLLIGRRISATRAAA